MEAARDEFAARGCSVLVVTQAKPEFVRHFLSKRPYAAAFASDPDRVVYRAFGLERTPWQVFARPRVLLGYLAAMFRGYAPVVPYRDEDVLQLGGDFVLDHTGQIVFAYRSREPTDRPSVTALLAALPSTPPMGGNRAPDAPQVDSPPAGG